MELTVALFGVAAFLVLYFLWKNMTAQRYQLPPGPKGDFLVGHGFRRWYNTDFFRQTTSKYGDVFFLQVLWQKVVVVSSYEAIKEAFNSEKLSGRLVSPFSREYTANQHGLLMSEGPLWRYHRRFSLSVLRQFGLGKSKIEQTIRDELQFLRAEITNNNGCAFYPSLALTKAVSNVTNSIVFNERCSEDAQFKQIMDVVRIIVTTKQQDGYFQVFWPIYKYLPGDASGLKAVWQCRDALFKYVSKKYQSHKETLDPANVRDYIDAFLLEAKNEDAPDTFTETQLTMAILDLFIAGSETTSTSISWGMILLAKHPEVQRKVHEEIERTIGDSKLPEMADRTKMRYTDAFIHEVLRCSAVVHVGLPHRAMETEKLRGYDVPKGSIVLSDIWNANRTGSWWKDPLHFNPQNFLDDQGNLINTNYLLSFSSGKRVCLGESLARQQMFIFLVGLVQQFEFVQDPSKPLPGFEDSDVESIVLAPPHFEIIAKRR